MATSQRQSIFTLLLLSALGVVATIGNCLAAGTMPAANGEFYKIKEDLSDLYCDKTVSAKIKEENGAKKIEIAIPPGEGYPGINFPVPAGGWDFSDFTGAQIEVTNPGKDFVTANLKIENEGDWKKSPWSVDMVSLNPGQTRTLKVVFGQIFGHFEYKLDPAHVTAVRLYVVPPKGGALIVVGEPKLIKEEVAVAVAAPPVAEAPQPPTPPEPPVVKPPPVFPPTAPLDITGKHDFAGGVAIADDLAPQLKGLCSLAEFRAFPQADRHVYAFDPWPNAQDIYEAQTLVLNFNLGKEGVTNQKVALFPDGSFPLKPHQLSRQKDATSGQYRLSGIGNLNWGANQAHIFKFNRPVLAFGVVLRSTGDMDLKRFYWAAAHELNGYPVSYTLADGSVIQLGEREKASGIIKANTDTFLGVADHSGRGIVSFSYTGHGLAGNKGQDLDMLGFAFVTPPSPAFAPVVALRSSCDFADPDSIANAPASPVDGLSSLEDFRFIVADHRYVYDFSTWPQAKPDLHAKTATFAFDLKGDGKAGEKLTVTASSKDGDANLTQTVLTGSDTLPYQALGGLGNIGKGAWAEQTFKFDKPVWSFGVTYSSPDDVQLARTGQGAVCPVSYTLGDGTVVNLGSKGSSGGILAGKGKAFVGLLDQTDKGISSVTIRLQGMSSGAQPVYIENVAFARAGPPLGKWKLTMDDEFNGTKLDPAHWTTGYTFPNVINNEMQGYVPENVVVANGVCSIKVEKRECVNTDRTGRKGGTRQFASGAFTSYDKFTQTYGYFEARIKMPHTRGAGIWPAFWMLPDRGRDYGDERGGYRTKDYGMGSEIDMFEFMPWWKQQDGGFSIHVGTIWSYGPATAADPDPHGYGSFALDNSGWGPDELHFPNLDTQFHTYGIYWSPERLIYYLDSKPIFRVKDPKNVADVPEYFLFNIAMSGNGWGKGANRNNPAYDQIVTDLPNQMDIDYFRAYSGTLEEATPTSPSDIPVIRKYPRPPVALPSATAAASSSAPAPQSSEVPAAPVNSTITSPAQ